MPHRPTQRKAPDVCPVCGEDVPPNALACPECGADDNTGWKEANYDGLDLPNDDFDYDTFVKKEFGSSKRPEGMSKPLWIITIVVIVLLVFAWVL